MSVPPAPPAAPGSPARPGRRGRVAPPTGLLRVTLRTLRAEASRSALCALAVVLGVAFLAGTLMVTDGMRAGAYARAGAFDRHTDLGVYAGTTALPPALLDRVRAVPGVAAAAGELTAQGGLLGADGRPVLGYALLVAVPTEPALRSYDVVAGRLPGRPGEVVLDAPTVARQGFRLGAPVRVGGGGGAARAYTLVGTVDVAGSVRDVGGPFIGLVGADALAATGAAGYGRILVAAAPGTPTAALTARVADAVGAAGTVRTRQQILDAAVAEAVRDVRQFSMVLLAFAAVAVVVAAFVIANTFTIVLAQRTRRTALLRVVGAGRGQLFRAALLEAGVLGLLSSALGVLAGVGLAVVLRWVGAALDLPAGSGGAVAVRPSTVLACLSVGTVTTLVAAALPAWQGSRVPPVAALTDGALAPARRPGRVRLVAGAVVLAAGGGALAAAVALGQVLLVAAGGILTFLGVVLYGPLLVPALVRLCALPLRSLLGATATLAVADAVRNPRRTAATAGALVVGVALVSAFVVGAASVKASIERAVDSRIGVDYLVTGIGSDLPAGVTAALAARPELGVVHEQRSRVVDGVEVRAVHPALVARSAGAVIEGSRTDLRPGRVLVHRELARERGWTDGSSVGVAGRRFEVAAVVADGDSLGGMRGVRAGHVVELPDADFAALFPTERGFLTEVQPAAGVPAYRARAAIEQVLRAYPTVNLLDRAAYKRMLTGTVDMLLGLVTVLLGLAVVIALVGVANTLGLSVLERAREHAVLRAVGLSRSRLRLLLVLEAALTAAAGALLGVALGGLVAGAAMGALARIAGGFTLTLPWGRLGLLVGAALLAAVAASVLPARRALARPVVAALGAE
ncbi:FtsX-like permease family protein [Micromonospora mirobrigensis]|uniref:Putative ABC transport system permease protein n=1 Tax=Micromonospora mirobrigensis TaxID=262898 RepID=A0A1C4WG53_9ACTN|nr:putative ABC transport system permease protein [Micromonospora mirobrigensis]